MEEKEIDNVKVFRYLGGNIKYDEHSTGDEEIELRLESGEAKFYELVKKLLNHKIVLKTRVQILNSLVRSRCMSMLVTHHKTKAVTVLKVQPYVKENGKRWV